jgi:hypothetical protein
MLIVKVNISLPYGNFCKFVGAEMITNDTVQQTLSKFVSLCLATAHDYTNSSLHSGQKSHAVRDASIFLAVHDACPPATRASNPRLTTSRRDATTHCSHVAECVLERMRGLVKRGLNRIAHKSLLLHRLNPTALTQTSPPITLETRPLLPSGTVVPVCRSDSVEARPTTVKLVYCVSSVFSRKVRTLNKLYCGYIHTIWKFISYTILLFDILLTVYHYVSQ